MTEQSQAQTLLLIFRKESPDLFHLLNETGLPISANSPLIKPQTQGKTLVVAPLLLVAVTEAMRANQDVFGGFEYLMSWTANDFRHFYVILEKRLPSKAKSDDDNNGSSSPWGSKPDDQKSNSAGWGDNNNNDTNNSNSNDHNWNSGSAWGDNNNSLNDNNNSGSNDAWGAPPGSPVKDNSSSSNNVASEFANHAWPADLVSANYPNGNGNRNGNGRGRSASGTSDWNVRDWARSPSEVGGARAGSGGVGWGGGTPGSSKGKCEW